jgi:hypothetical protein
MKSAPAAKPSLDPATRLIIMGGAAELMANPNDQFAPTCTRSGNTFTSAGAMWLGTKESAPEGAKTKETVTASDEKQLWVDLVMFDSEGNIVVILPNNEERWQTPRHPVFDDFKTAIREAFSGVTIKGAEAGSLVEPVKLELKDFKIDVTKPRYSLINNGHTLTTVNGVATRTRDHEQPVAVSLLYDGVFDSVTYSGGDAFVGNPDQFDHSHIAPTLLEAIGLSLTSPPAAK